MSSNPTSPNKRQVGDVLGDLSVKYPGLPHLASLIVAGVFLYAAIGKLYDSSALAADLIASHFPLWLTDIITAYIPYLEVTTALALLWPRTRMGASMVLLTLLMIFTLYLASIALTGGQTCSCMGGQTTRIETALFRNMCLLALTGGIYSALAAQARRTE